ncbi:Protein of unknown function [Bacillus cytotoxicus]|uniref:Uncharacterized protein n=1 Tax=Bacillus cytotoxicus TaxID=580165 RepID=A0AAX2CHI6_9BACI|nr:Protein of unknown function [Bacillus cytotoxicus]SCN37190.1 Protein of unknown function [Bacillus cytotoxicus]
MFIARCEKMIWIIERDST